MRKPFGRRDSGFGEIAPGAAYAMPELYGILTAPGESAVQENVVKHKWNLYAVSTAKHSVKDRAGPVEAVKIYGRAACRLTFCGLQ